MCFFVVAAPASSNGDDVDAESSLPSKGVSALMGLSVVITAVRACKLCGEKCSDPHPFSAGDDDEEQFWPWLHHKKVDAFSKAPSGRMCMICRTVFRLCALQQEHGSVKRYLKWKNEKDSVTRHSFFMRGLKRYLELCRSKGESVCRLHIRQRDHL